MDNFSFDTVQQVRNHFYSMNQLQGIFASAKKKIKALGGNLPGTLPRIEYLALELSFEAIRDDSLRQCMEALPTKGL